jgi:hypothetical protein
MRSSVSNCAKQAQKTSKTFDNAINFAPHDSVGHSRGAGTFAAWLNRIVENQCLMRIREPRSS